MSSLDQSGAERLEAARTNFNNLFPSIAVFATDAWGTGLDPSILDTVFAKKPNDPVVLIWEAIRRREEELETVFGGCQVLLEGLFAFKDLTGSFSRTDALLTITRALEKAISARMDFWGEAFDRLFPSVNRLVDAGNQKAGVSGLSTLEYFYNKMASSLDFGWQLMSYQDMIIAQELAAAAKALEAFGAVISDHENERLAPRGSSLEQLAGKANLKVTLHKLSKKKEERGQRLGVLLRTARHRTPLPRWGK